jgi:glucose-1-phosphate cytidylyltransferase
MKAVILAGGQGSRMSTGPDSPPKPLTKIGGHPVLWHVMKLLHASGFKDFVIAIGHRAGEIRNYVESNQEDHFSGMKVDLVDTGERTATGGRLKRLESRLNDSPFLLAFSDGLADIDFERMLHFHQEHGKLATLAAVHPPARFGVLDLEGNHVREFREKDPADMGWINGGFFIFEPGIFHRMNGDRTKLNRDLLPELSNDSELMAYRHEGFWQCMDTPAEKKKLETLWQSGQAPWKIW